MAIMTVPSAIRSRPAARLARIRTGGPVTANGGPVAANGGRGVLCDARTTGGFDGDCGVGAVGLVGVVGGVTSATKTDSLGAVGGESAVAPDGCSVNRSDHP